MTLDDRWIPTPFILARLLLACLAWTFALPSPGQAQDAAPLARPEAVTEARVETGSRLYNGGSCTVCHAAAGLGTGARAPDLSDAEWLHGAGDLEGIRQVIFWGVEKNEMKAEAPRPFAMNPQGGMGLDSEQLLALAAYVWSLGRPETSELVATQRRFLEATRYRSPTDAEAVFRDAATRWPDRPLLAERALNREGYDLLASRPEAAVMVFRLNAEANPGSWNVHDSLGEGYEAVGDTARAIESYRRSLDLNRENERAAERLRALGGGAG